MKRNLTTGDQVKQALMEKIDDDFSDRPHRQIGAILFEKDSITREQMDAGLKSTPPSSER